MNKTRKLAVMWGMGVGFISFPATLLAGYIITVTAKATLPLLPAVAVCIIAGGYTGKYMFRLGFNIAYKTAKKLDLAG